MDSKKNRIAEAVREQFNLVGLAGALALSVATLNPLPLLVGAIAEAAYLLFVPDTRWYDARLAARFDAEVDDRRAALKAQVFPSISAPMQERFTRLEAIRAQINTQTPGGTGDDRWFREVVRKLDYLLEKFLLFAQKEAQFRTYLQSVWEQVQRDQGVPPPQPRQMPLRPGTRDVISALVADFDLFDSPRERRSSPAGAARRDTAPENLPPRLADKWAQQTVKSVQSHYDAEITEVNAEYDTEDDLNTQAILTKRADVLQQRKEYVGKIGKILTNLGHQMELLEDSFGLINDQMRARSPEQVLADIEGVVYQTDSMTKLLDELAPYEQMSQRLAA